MAMQRSVVKWFDAKKGYGFIVNPQGGSDVFVHYSQIDTERRFKTLRTGQVVEYDLEDGPKGLHAVNIGILDEQPQLPQQPSAPRDTYAPPSRPPVEESEDYSEASESYLRQY